MQSLAKRLSLLYFLSNFAGYACNPSTIIKKDSEKAAQQEDPSEPKSEEAFASQKSDEANVAIEPTVVGGAFLRASCHDYTVPTASTPLYSCGIVKQNEKVQEAVITQVTVFWLESSQVVSFFALGSHEPGHIAFKLPSNLKASQITDVHVDFEVAGVKHNTKAVSGLNGPRVVVPSADALVDLRVPEDGTRGFLGGDYWGLSFDRDPAVEYTNRNGQPTWRLEGASSTLSAYSAGLFRNIDGAELKIYPDESFNQIANSRFSVRSVTVQIAMAHIGLPGNLSSRGANFYIPVYFGANEAALISCSVVRETSITQLASCFLEAANGTREYFVQQHRLPYGFVSFKVKFDEDKIDFVINGKEFLDFFLKANRQLAVPYSLSLGGQRSEAIFSYVTIRSVR